MTRCLIQSFNHLYSFFRSVIFAAGGNLDTGDELVWFGGINEGGSGDAAESGASDAKGWTRFEDCDHIEFIFSIRYVASTICLCILLAVAACCLEMPVTHAEFDLCSYAGQFIFCNAII